MILLHSVDIGDEDMEWKKKYFSRFNEFVDLIGSWNPDYIVPIGRKAYKLLKANKKQIGTFSDKIFFKEYFEFCQPNINGAKVAVFDDSANYGTTLYVHRIFFETLGAEVNYYAFAIKESNFKNSLYRNPNTTYKLRFGDQEYLEYLSCQKEFLMSIDEPLDIDHLVLNLELTSSENLEEIIFILGSIGRLHFFDHVKKNVLKFSLDFPCLFKTEDIGKTSRFLKFDGISKIRFLVNKEKNILTIYSMVFPTFDANKITKKTEIQIVEELDIIENPSFEKLLNNNEFAYMYLTFQLSALISSRLLSFLLKNNYLNNAISKLKINHENFKHFFGEENGKFLSNKIISNSCTSLL